MKTKAISSFFVLFAIAAGIVAMTPAAFADHPEVIIATTGDAMDPACEPECYTPSTATVEVGVKVIFSNPTGFHSFTSGTMDGFTPNPTGVFDTGILNAGDSGEWTPENPGEYPYYCSLHSWMYDVIIVENAHAAEAAAALAAEEAAALAAEEAAAEPELMIVITDSVVLDGTQIELNFSELHVNYDITATQNGEVIFEETGLHSMEHIATHQIDAVGSDENPIDVEVISLGIGAPGHEADWTGPTGSVATAKVVPEFGTIAMMILAVAIISIVAVTAKSRVIPRF